MAAFKGMLCFICLGVLIPYANGQSVHLTVMENQPSGTSLGFVTRGADFLNTLDLSQKTNLRYKILTQRNSWWDYFRIDEGTGEILTTAVLDREKMCTDEGGECQLAVDVAAHADAFLRLFRVQITITDINDNVPEFPESYVTVHIPESASINYTVPIRGATDRDTGKTHGVQSYEIIPSDGQFTVRLIENLDGSPEVGIVVRRKLDRELISSHSVEVLAKDGGVPPKTGTVKVTILVTDVNDHSPIFTRSVYNITVKEDLPMNARVVQVRAADQDTGENGQVNYRFSSRTASKFPNIFIIDSASGEVKCNSVLDYESRREYRLVVEATDQGSPRRTSQALVIVNLQDVNDNSPIVSFNFLSGKDAAKISENGTVDEFIAHISVADKDQKLNSVVSCQTKSNLFKIERLYDNEFQVVLNTSLDRETRPEMNVTVVCTDTGRPPLSDSRTFRVIVLDENDNSPRFAFSRHTVTVPEDLSIGDKLLTVTATDADSLQNGMVAYSLTGEHNDLFVIESKSGRISVAQRLDYESVTKMTVIVEARDGGQPALSSSTVIYINVLDVNDEAPEFNQTSYEFVLLENSAGGESVGRVQASDPDLSFGGLVSYSLEHPSFSVTADGFIQTLGPLDRETTEVVRLTVMAKDTNKVSQITEVEVTVRILDVNDNGPIITFPNDTNNTVFLPHGIYDYNKPVLVTSVLAHDVDAGENQTLVYALENQEQTDNFRIDSDNGSVWFLNKSPNSEGQRYTVDILVMDGGMSPLQTTSRLYVIVPSTGLSGNTQLASNIIAVIIVVSLTSVLSALILLGICMVRKSTEKELRKGATTHEPLGKGCGYRVKIEASQIDDVTKCFQEEVEKKENTILSDDTLIQKPETCSPLRLTTDSPVDVFELSQQARTGIWLNLSGKAGHLIPRTSSTNSRFTGKSFSQLSLDRMTSDSGRGGSEAGSQDTLPAHDGLSTPAAVKCPSLDCSDGDYMDMQKSRLSSISNLVENGCMYGNIHTPYQTFSPGLGSASARTPSVRAKSFKGDNSNLCGTPNHNSYATPTYTTKQQQTLATKNFTTKFSDVNRPVYIRQPSASDSDGSATTTSGSYTIEHRDFVEFDQLPPMCAEFDV